MNRSLAAMLVLTACGGGSFNSSLNKNKQLSELSEDESCKLAEELVDWVTADYAQDFCYFLAQSSGAAAEASGQDFTEACEQAHDDCLSDLDFEPEGECSEGFGDGCDATIGDLEECYSVIAETFADLAKTKCRPLELSEIQERSETVDLQPAECEPIMTCDGF